MKKSQIYAALLSPWIGIVGILIAIYLNSSWWALTDNAISDLGNIKRPWVNHPYVLNTTLMIAGACITYFLIFLFMELKSKIAKAGAGIFILGAISLFLIGVFPEEASILGFEPHYYVSWGFFFLGSLGMLIIGISALLERETRHFGVFTVLLYIMGWIIVELQFRIFKGVAIPEFTGVIALSLWMYVALLWKKAIPSML